MRIKGKPVFLVFGPQYYKGPQWTEMFQGHDIAIYGVNGKYDFSTDGYAWPYPKGGNERMEQFYRESSPSRGFIGVAYPRFDDIYAEAKVHESWGSIPDNNGKTFVDTYRWALGAKSPIIQIATWNDWGEGTVIEPSVEYQYRDLETLQRFRRQSEPTFKYKPADLRLPVQLYQLRKKAKQGDRRKLDRASSLLTAGNSVEAAKLLR
ncbi:MAG: hypothetical protein H7Y17_00825 [Chlorobia bacterium]|nr:hypothetical protein [Fimbriimonadaceae bacterium]